MLSLLSLLTVLLAFAAHVHAAQFTLHHRVVHPSLQDAPFLERGTLELSGSSAHIASASTAAQNLVLFEQQLHSAKDKSGALYQIALQQPGTAASQGEWSISSVKVCHLGAATSQTLFVYLSEDGSPYSINNFVSPIPHNGACPSPSPDSPLRDFAGRITSLNTTILLRTPSSPPSPELKTPPPLTPEGEVVQPVPEKGFFQKYWMYITIFLVAIMLTGGGPEEGQGAGK
ncbi:hypothetical protein DFP72DRAFT_909923 [Ephemerocybe angulata]|uniref:ER membrane protein complex subunit 10 n=1 Tax=Ephemerocybe angulata TaxID=980116 RepID=A0A8H6M0D2_9AGAR|nr:hypothetical protein DFP72DRAFT_909923 [Tulosesus angulatus]